MTIETVTLFLIIGLSSPSIQSVGTFSGATAMARCVLAAESATVAKSVNPEQISWQLICVPTKVK
jgi:hypothetical protein